jgi:rfaE bifunctional protein kinase chain/domain
MVRRMAAAGLVHRFARARVVLLGDLVADVYQYGETERVSREAPVLVVRHESTETKLGGAANAAANIAALGGRVSPVGVVGKDAAGRELLRQFQDLRAETGGILVSAGRCTETKTRVLAGARSTTRQQMLRIDRAEEKPLTEAERSRIRQRLTRACRNAQALVVSDYGSGLIDGALTDEVRKIARRLPVCVDSRYGIRSFHGVTLAKPNEAELEAAIGGRVRTSADLERAGRVLLEQLQVRALVVTRGHNGMSLFETGKPTVSIPVWGPAEAVDVTGAGDTVLATLTLALAVGAGFEEAARLANVAGGIVVQKPGTATCSSAELLAALEPRASQPRIDARARPAALRRVRKGRA